MFHLTEEQEGKAFLVFFKMFNHQIKVSSSDFLKVSQNSQAFDFFQNFL